MGLTAKQPYKDDGRVVTGNVFGDAVSSFGNMVNDWLARQTPMMYLLIIGVMFIGIFSIFRGINRGHVTILSENSNVLNMTGLLLICLVLQMLWMAYNGDETQGFGGM